METRTPHWRIFVLPAAFALVCVVLTVVAYNVFGGSLPFTPEGYRITIPLPEATNLVSGSGVDIAGVKVGKVVAVNRSGNTATARIELRSQFAPLRSGATAVARTKTLLGEGYIALAPGPRTAPPIPDGGTLPASHVRSEVDLDQFISTFDGATRARMQHLFTGLSAALSRRSQALSDSLGSAAPFTSSLNTVLATVAGQSPALGRVISSSGSLLSAVGQRAGALQSAVEAGTTVLSVTAARDRALASTVSALAPFLTQLHTTADEVTAASPALDAAVGALLPAARLIAPALESIDTAAPKFRTLFDGLPATLTAGRHALPSLTAILRAARPGLKAFYPAARNLIPFMQLFALNSKIPSIIADVGDVTGGTYVGPGGVVINYGTGIPSIWNETISGWAHKLPTNRQNPYPEPPDALLETGQSGVLKAYDCRNIHNPLWIPPTGTGAPPCVLQGPWTFDGKSAYYPRLQLASP